MSRRSKSLYASASSVSKRRRIHLVERDPYKRSPSAVVFVSELLPGVTENEVVQVLEQFGPIAEVAMMPQKHQALVEFEEVRAARRLVELFRSGEKICICGQAAFVNFSMSHGPGLKASLGDRTQSKVLSFTVYNAQYPVTLEVIHTICKAHAKVLRIVMLRNSNPLKVLVEFDDVFEARRVKRFLNGANIYSGCCSLKVEPRKHAKKWDSLDVPRNDSDSWDYTSEPFIARGGPPLISLLLPGPPAPGLTLGIAPPPGQPDNNRNQSELTANFSKELSGTSRPLPSNSPGSVVFVLNLPVNRFNCNTLFNLCCLYGNVHRVKCLKNHEGAALVQMSDADAAKRVIQHLTGCVLFGQLIELRRSKHPIVTDLGKFELYDKTQSFKDYTYSENNRFKSDESMTKNHILAPSATLHFYNCAPTIRDEELAHFFEQLGAPRPLRVHKFSGSADKASLGLLEFDSISAACDALAIANHHKIKMAGSKFSHTMKLAFGEWKKKHERDSRREMTLSNPQRASPPVFGLHPSESASPEAAPVPSVPAASLSKVTFPPGAGEDLFVTLLFYSNLASLARAMQFPVDAGLLLTKAPGPAPPFSPHFPYSQRGAPLETISTHLTTKK